MKTEDEIKHMIERLGKDKVRISEILANRNINRFPKKPLELEAQIYNGQQSILEWVLEI